MKDKMIQDEKYYSNKPFEVLHGKPCSNFNYTVGIENGKMFGTYQRYYSGKRDAIIQCTDDFEHGVYVIFRYL